MACELIKLEPDEVVEVHEILEKCGRDMKLRLGLGHWSPAYPFHLLRKDAEEKSVYAVRDGDITIATFTLGVKPQDYYEMMLWESQSAKATYVSRLAVAPDVQGGGIGAWCMKKIERIAVERGCAAVRLDAYEKHLKLLKFYDKLGYIRRGTVRFKDCELLCFEKVMGLYY